ncbi:MAG: helix-turn-helix domain-containing protein [Sulfitobacter sp.]|nr:helix-turn-helix domain-containing protein [Sulfitobacter sp.]
MNTRDHASTFAKGLSVLSCFEGGERDLTMADIAQRTGFDRAVARRLCLTLEAEGYLTRAGKFLRLTPRVLALAGGFLTAEGIGRAVLPVLNRYAEDLNGEIALAVLDGRRAIYVAHSAVGSARMSLGFSVGSTLPLLPTAVGTMLLASCAQSRRDEILATCPPQAYTPRTEMRPEAIRARIEAAEARGHAYLSEEFEVGAAGLAIALPSFSNATAVLATSASATVLADRQTREAALDTLFRAASSLRGR